MTSIGVFTPEQTRLLWQDYQSRLQLNPSVSKNLSQRRPIAERTGRRSAVLAEALTAPASSLAVATECDIYFIDLKSDGTQEVIDGIKVAYNDDPDLTGDRGTYCRVERHNGRWMIYYVGCAPQSVLTAAMDAF